MTIVCTPRPERRRDERPNAQVAELVDALASGASGHYGRGSSSLLLGTISHNNVFFC